VLEHHHGGRYFTRATSPDYGGNGYARPPGPLLIGPVIGVIVDWAAGAIGSPQTTGAFGVLADLVRGVLPADTSALMLVAESPGRRGVRVRRRAPRRSGRPAGTVR
jgi:hypothetical protein